MKKHISILLIGLLLFSFYGFMPFHTILAEDQEIFEDFEDGIADGWNSVGSYGTWSVVEDGGNLAYTAPAGSGRSLYGTAWQGNIAFEVQVKPLSLAAYGSFTLMFAYSDPDNQYFVRYGNGTMNITRRVNGTNLILAEKSFDVNVNQTYTVKVVFSEGSIKLYVDGNEELSAEDSTFSSGKVGLVAYNANVLFDNVYITIPPVPVSDNTYYVSASAGDDENGDGSVGQPWQTIQKAAEEMYPGDTCIIREGVYRESVTPARMGVKDHPITFRAYPGETVTLSGTEPVANWVQDSGNIYKTTVSMNLEHENQVFYNGRMMFEARWPNAGGTSAENLLEFSKATMQQGTTATHIADGNLPDFDWTGGQVWVSSNRKWYDWTGSITGYGSGYLNIENNSDTAGNHVAIPGGSYYVFGVKDALDSGGEWYYDENNSLLYVWVPGGGNPGNSVEVKARSIAFDLTSKDYIHLEGLNIHGATVKMNGDSDYNLMDRLKIEYAYYSSQAENTYSSQLGTGVTVSGSNNTVRNCEIAYNSGPGLLIGGYNQYIVNNYIHDHDFIGGYGSPLHLNGARSSIISHNTIARAGRSCISGSLYDNLIQYNNVYDAGYLTSDLGLLYVNCIDGGNGEIRYNWFHDNYAEDTQKGIYLDHGVKNLIIHHNVVWGLNGQPFYNNMHANYLLWYNNTGSTTGDVGIGSTWANAMESDEHGSQWINNVVTGSIDIRGANATIMNNTVNYEELIDNKYLSAGSEPVDSATAIASINDSYVGDGPDKGAYELGGENWIPGHDFSNPPVNLNTTRSFPEFRNRIVNGSFEAGILAPWSGTGGDAVLNGPSSSGGQSVNNATALAGNYSARLGTGQNEIAQVVSGLEPDTIYEVMGKLRVDEGETACIGVRGYGNGVVESAAVSSTNSLWSKQSVLFLTGVESTTAEVYACKNSTGTGNVYVEDMGLQKIDGLGVSIQRAEEALDNAVPEIPQNVQDWLQQKISDSELVYLDEQSINQDLLDQANELMNAVAVFHEKETLAQKLDLAQRLHDSAVEGDEPGQYPSGTKAIFLTAINGGYTVLNNMNATLEQVKMSISELETARDAFLDQVVQVVRLYTFSDQQYELPDVDISSLLETPVSWSSPQNITDHAVTGINKYLGAEYRDQIFEFDMEYVYNYQNKDYPGFVMRSQKPDSELSWVCGDTSYFILIKPQQIELQRAYNGAPQMLSTAPNTVFGGGEGVEYFIQVGAVNTLEGNVRLLFYVNGVQVFDFVDADASKMITEEGYFGIHNGLDTGAVKITFNTSEEDISPPITSIIINGEKNNGWYTSDVTVTFTAQDDVSGIARTEYSIDGGETWEIYSQPIVLTADGTYNIKYRSIDKAGNIEEVKTVAFAMDKSAPILNLTVNGTPFEDGAVFEDYKPLSFAIEVEDNLSGVESSSIVVDGEPYQPDTQMDFAGKLGQHSIAIAAEDKAGNRTEISYTFEVTTGIDSMRELLNRYKASGDVKNPLFMQLNNDLKQAEFFMDKVEKQLGIDKQDTDKGLRIRDKIKGKIEDMRDKAEQKLAEANLKMAIKHMEDFIKHLNNKAMSRFILEDAKAVLNTDATALIEAWTKE